MSISAATKSHPNRHSGVSSTNCRCGLVHDDELRTGPEIRDQVVEVLGGRCANPDCRWMSEDGFLGCRDKIYLQVDHVFDDGYLEKGRSNAIVYWSRVLKQVQAGSQRYQLLCANCNWAKRLATPFAKYVSTSGKGC